MNCKINTYHHFLLFLTLALITACSPYSKKPFPDLVYHNTTSHYNAYFLARERMKELETELYRGYKDNYNRILDIYPKIDSNYSKGVKDKLDKIIKNASVPIQWHKYSHWVDDSYLIIGKCRYYDVDWENALTTFRFIHSRYEDNEVKHHALIWLMKTYMEQHEWDQARQWGDFLEEEYLSYPNMARFSLANGHYYLKQGDYKNAFEKLIVGAKYIKPKDYRAKIYFIIGQLGQKINKDKEAYEYYKKCLKSNPPYELWFYAKINMYQMQELKDEKDAEKVLAFYRKMLKDPKNVDFKDRIYYEMGYFQLKRNNLDEAITYFQTAAKEKKATSFNKSFAWLRIADIYYDRKQAFEKSSKFYDSTITVLEKDLPEYPRAYKRQRILKEFVEQLTIVRTEDSLQKLAKMDTAALSKLVSQWIKEDERKAKEAEKLQRKLEREKEAEKNAMLFNAANPGALPNIDPLAGGNDKWYFYNPVAVAAGKQEFLKKWGSRPLEDNWRRISKEKEDFGENDNQTAATAKDTSAIEKPMVSLDEQKQQYYSKIPLKKVQMDTSVARLKRALFRLARIYDFNLEEFPNAIATYDRYITEFPEEEKRPEAMYAVYIICKNKKPDDACREKYKNMLLGEYPNSLYAKLIKNPNYLKENRLLGERIKYLYRSAFEMYENEQFLEAQNAVASVMQDYPENEFEDRFRLLKAMIVGRTQSIKNYQDSLKAFISRYNRVSPLIPFAKDLLEKATNLEKEKGISHFKKVEYDLNLDYPHYLVVVVPEKNALEAVKEKFKSFNDNFYTDEKLKVEIQSLNDSSATTFITVKQLPNKIQGMNYYERMNGASSPLKSFPDLPFEYFILSDKNYNIMLREKAYKSYWEFFLKNYLRK